MNDESKQLVSDLRRWAHAPHALPASDMMDKAAAEIERLLVAIAAYAASSKAAAKEIARLRGGANTNTPTTAPAADGTDWPTSGAAVGSKAMTTDEKDVLTSVLLSEIGTAQKYNSLVFDLQAEIARLRLTDAEREAVEEAIRRLWGFDIAATLRGLLERLK